jgi:Ion channel
VGFALDFFATLAGMLLDAAPVLVLLLILIVGLAIAIGRREGWMMSDSIYYGFVTATTVGYGDFRPTRPASKAMAIIIAYLGLIQIGIIVALAVQATTEAYDRRAALAGEPSCLAANPAREPAEDWRAQRPGGARIDPKMKCTWASAASQIG